MIAQRAKKELNFSGEEVEETCGAEICRNFNRLEGENSMTALILTPNSWFTRFACPEGA
jgi:hypothetical protein